ncbi:16S rRNA (cytosine(967)-C(5))-methyltransferase RsmB [Kroppenstedtia pulmonis]|uniref:16S rRNA (cytosine(967)-C(5))-methyltransferase n=1 Tax=Kroppenstedtia pulmonis TaxID=1380685 RepID=A0A7D3Y0R1_9BACL|nr:16S rRNA (cytosine(967)-C(5))-methyltransferase RsmB [Kroppenstedtia pulmonis]QKG84680.1 16S rRNA (cytosine(967)-C(5))-methyltransferase RsmB [Kroppenstedtia pulmonis]
MNAREVALEVLIQWEEREGYSNLLLREALEQSGLNIRDRGLTTELVYGTIQRRNTLDWVLNQLLRQDLGDLDSWLRQLLRLGVYQLRFLDKIPPRAAVHETVQMAKNRGHQGTASLVNGVLRSYLRREMEWKLPEKPETIREWALVYSHPKWLIKRFIHVYGEEEARQMLEAHNQPPKVSLRTNPLKISREALIRDLSNIFPEADIQASSVSDQGIVMEGGGNPTSTEEYRQGYFSIQDESSMLVAQVVSPRPGQRGVDACAAPGGKATHLVELMKDQGQLIAYDIHPHKVKLIRESACRLGLSALQGETGDARRFSESLYKTCDFVLLDAPCSGLGVIRRKPDIKWRKTAQQIEEILPLQAELLRSAAKLVKPGGTLVYSTCTLDPRENEEMVASFLASHRDFRPDPCFSDYLPDLVQQRGLFQGAGIQILPHHFQSDGFYIARLIRV